jgi:hypothetical protein
MKQVVESGRCSVRTFCACPRMFTCVSNCHYKNQYWSGHPAERTGPPSLHHTPCSPSSHLSGALAVISRLSKRVFLPNTHPYTWSVLTQWTCRSRKAARTSHRFTDNELSGPSDWGQSFGTAMWRVVSTLCTWRHKYPFTSTFYIPRPLVRKRTIPTERPPLVDEILCQLLRKEGCRAVNVADPPQSLISVF